MDKTTDTFINNLKRLLEEKKITQYQLSKMAGLSCACINNYIKGRNRPLLTQASKICDVLDVSLETMCCENCEGSKPYYSFTNSELQLIADCFYSLNLEGKHQLVSISKSLACNSELTEHIRTREERN